MNDPYKPLDVGDLLVYLQIGATYSDDDVFFEAGKHSSDIIAKQYNEANNQTLESVIHIHMPDIRHVARFFPGFLIGDAVTVVFIGSYWENRQGVVYSVDEEKKLIRVYFEFAQAYADFQADELLVLP